MEDQLRIMNQKLDAFIRRQDELNKEREAQNKANRRHEEVMERLRAMAPPQRGHDVLHQQSPMDDRSAAELGNNSSHKPLNFTPKIEFPKFNGTNTRNWINKCGNYFELYKIPGNQRFKIAVSHMSDKAEVWVNSYLAAKRTVSWYEFLGDLNARFRDDDSGTVVEQFDKSQQVDDLGVNGNDVHLVFDEVTDPLSGNEVDEFVVTDVDEFEHVKSVLMQSNHKLLEDVCETSSLLEVASENAMKFDIVEDRFADDMIMSTEDIDEVENNNVLKEDVEPGERRNQQLETGQVSTLFGPELFDQSPKREKIEVEGDELVIMDSAAPEDSQFDTRQFDSKMTELFGANGEEFFTSYDEVHDSFDTMGLQENLLVLS